METIAIYLVLSMGKVNHAQWPQDMMDNTVATVQLRAEHKSGFFAEIEHRSNPTTDVDRGAEFASIGYKLRLK